MNQQNSSIAQAENLDLVHSTQNDHGHTTSLGPALDTQMLQDAQSVLGSQHSLVHKFSTAIWEYCYNFFINGMDNAHETLQKLSKIIPSFNRIIYSYVAMKKLEMKAANHKEKENSKLRPSSFEKGLSDQTIDELSRRLHNS